MHCPRRTAALLVARWHDPSLIEETVPVGGWRGFDPVDVSFTRTSTLAIDVERLDARRACRLPAAVVALDEIVRSLWTGRPLDLEHLTHLSPEGWELLNEALKVIRYGPPPADTAPRSRRPPPPWDRRTIRRP